MNAIGGLVYPIAQHAPTGIVARRGDEEFCIEQFQQDIAALTTLLPEHQYVINLCSDRYRFMVGFAAALLRGQISLMPSTNVPEAIRHLGKMYPDSYVFIDGGNTLAAHRFDYPETLGDTKANIANEVAGAQLAAIQFTSGSTGDPKSVPKSWATLVHSARAAGTRLGASELSGATIVGTVPHQHSFGLESILMLALQHGFAVESSMPLYPADIQVILDRTPRPRILVTTPVHLRALVADANGMPAVDLILSATAPLPEALATAAEVCFSAPLMEIYGCTEAGQIATRRSTKGKNWHILDGINLFEHKNEIWASGPAVEGIAPVFDEIDFINSRFFRLGARATDLVNIAGKRSSISYLTNQLLAIPGVEDGVFLLDNLNVAGLVQRLFAVAVAPAYTVETLQEELRERIDPVFLPRRLVLVRSLPRNALGKLPRADLLHLLGRDHE